ELDTVPRPVALPLGDPDSRAASAVRAAPRAREAQARGAGELEAARAALEEGQALTDPTAAVFVAEYHDALGNVHRWQGRLGAALEHYRRALELVEGVGEWPNRRRIRLQIAQ
ncbi:tetratricopeptide repeat protein, partial [Vibrio parahaemolyticus]